MLPWRCLILLSTCISKLSCSDKIPNSTVHRADFTDHRSNTRHIKTVAYLVIVIAFLYTCIPGRPKRSTWSPLVIVSRPITAYKGSPNRPDSISLKLAKCRAGMRHGAVMCTRLWTLAAQEYPPVIGYPAADNPDQFRIYWACNGNTSKYKDNTPKTPIDVVLQLYIMQHNTIRQHTDTNRYSTIH